MSFPDYFAFFDLPRNLVIDPADLERRFYTLSRELHPDRFARKSAEERQYSLDATAWLNDAYRALRDPVGRAMYLLKLEGFDVGEQSGKDVPPELLEEVFELNEAIEDSGSGEALDPFRVKFLGMQSEIDDELHDRFSEWDREHNREILGAIRGLLNRRKYITNLIAQTHVPD